MAPNKSLKIVFVGNFDVPYSTESHHAWTWRHLGHEVIPLQENRTSAGEILRACENAQLFQWTHTHSWGFPGEEQITPANLKIPSFSYHLDVYHGIGSREKTYLQHPSFHLNHFFSTDGGHEDAWKRAGINHHWLSAGVVQYGAEYEGQPREKIDVLFTGSVSYHQEYPYRAQLIRDLAANYGDRFQVRTGVRENALNDLYASASVCVGDHIFSGCPYYWSDRLPESAGRGAFIIYPETRGLEEYVENGLVTYRPQDSSDLINKIDFYLDKAHETERVERRNKVREYVRKNHTYTQKLQQILEKVNASQT